MARWRGEILGQSPDTRALDAATEAHGRLSDRRTIDSHAMLVDARWPPPEPEPEPRSVPWAAVGWPLLTVALLATGYLVPPLVAYACVIGALYCAVESFARLVPRTGGLREHKQ